MDSDFRDSYSIIRDSFKCSVSHRYVDCVAPFIGKLKSINITTQLNQTSKIQTPLHNTQTRPR
jgi:hypothetical protein